MMNTWIWILGWVISLVVCSSVLSERRAPTATAAWLILLLALPYVGAVIYLLIGTRKMRRRPVRVRRLQHGEHTTVPAEEALPIDRMLRRLGVPGAMRGNAVTLLPEAREARLALLDVINGAERELLMLIYHFECDRIGLEVMDALIASATRGVKLYLMVDDLGSSALVRHRVQALQAAGGRVVRFRPVWFALFKRAANLRNHRKIVVADGARAWSGGRNISDAYLADHAEQKRWLDLSFRIDGPAARVLDEICRSDWRFATDEALPMAEQVACNCSDNVSAQIIASGPDQRDDVWHIGLIKACFEARERIWIVTPYCVPDDSFMNALMTAARSGIDVRVMVPRRSDNRLVDFVSKSYLREMQRTGIKIRRYEGGMLHAKAVLIDDDIAIVGSANLDARSFFLNYEMMAVFNDRGIAESLERYMNHVSARSSNGTRPVGMTAEMLGNFARILAPMM